MGLWGEGGQVKGSTRKRWGILCKLKEGDGDAVFRKGWRDEDGFTGWVWRDKVFRQGNRRGSKNDHRKKEAVLKVVTLSMLRSQFAGHMHERTKPAGGKRKKKIEREDTIIVGRSADERVVRGDRQL